MASGTAAAASSAARWIFMRFSSLKYLLPQVRQSALRMANLLMAMRIAARNGPSRLPLAGTTA